MGGCLARPAETRRVDVVRPARSEDARGKDEDRPSRPFSSRLRLSPLDSALCIRGLVVYWAFGFDRRLDPDAVRASLAAALVKFPALAGRARVRARRGATVELEVDLEHPHAGVAFEVRDDPATTLEDLQRAGPPSARDNVTPSTLFRPLHIRCCEKEGLLCAVRLTRLGGDAAPATVLGVSWSHALADGCAMRAFCEAWTSEALAQSAAGSPPRRPLRDPSHDRLEVLAGVEPRDARAFPALRLEENQSALALARGACGVLGDVAFARLAQVTVHLPAADARALKASLDATSTNDAVLAATWTLFRRLKKAGDRRARKRRRGRGVASETGSALQPVNYRGDDVRGLPLNLFGNASLMVCARLEETPPDGAVRDGDGDGDASPEDPRRVSESPEKADARRMARATRVSVRAAKSAAGAARARGEIFALASVSTATQIAAAVAAVANVECFLSAWQFPEIWDFDFDGNGAGDGPAYFFGSVLPAAAWTCAAWPARGGGLDVSMNVPRRLAARVPREMREVVRLLSDGNVPARGAG